MNTDKNSFSIQEAQENNVKDQLMKYLHYWKWFLMSIVMSLFLGFVYLRYQTPVYEASATILIKDDKKGAGISDELSAFQDLGMLKVSSNIDNEIEILKSRSLMSRVVEELRLNVSYFAYGRPIEHERFFNTPVVLLYSVTDSVEKKPGGNWILIPESNKKFKLKRGDTKEVIGDFNFGDSIPVSFGKICFVTTDNFTDSYLSKDFRVVMSPVDLVVNKYLHAIKIIPVNKNSNAIIISLKDPLPDKAVAIVDNLINQHNLDAISDKNEVSKNTANFINDRIAYITAELSDVEEQAESFKVKYKLTDVESEAKLVLQTGNASEIGILEANTQKALADYMYDYILKHTASADLIPANLGLSDISVGGMISEYNKLVLDRNRLIKYSSDKNPGVENLDDQLSNIRKSIKESLLNYRTALEIKVRELSRQETGINSKIASVPKYEREYRIIQRQQQIKETLYMYLLQKREETNIALAVTVSNTKVVDNAYSNNQPVAPKKSVIFFAAIFLGILIPILILYLKDILDNKVHGKKDIDRIGVPFLGDIPVTTDKNKIVVARGENSSVAEAFRLLRTNIDFMLTACPSKGRVVFLTSTLGKEGKSFIAINLATSLAISGKKVVLVGFDVRAPKILEYLGLDEKEGVTNYLSRDNIQLDGLILRSNFTDSLDVLPSGSIPPNPAELLMSEKIPVLFKELKERYDYVIVDTAPIGMVTDTLLLSKYADAFIYVVRAYYLDKRLLSVAEDLYKEKRLPNMAILINGTDKEKGYGYGYGYGYGGYGYGHEKPRPLWKKLLSIK